MPAAPLLSPQEVEQRLADVPEWKHKAEEKLIERKFVFGDFREAMGFLVRVAFEAEEMDHHPDVALSYKRLTLQLTTHASQGLTEKDFALAKKIDALLSKK
jgi:4a-hydroxytetrahydrobiopterin dehydratase